MSDTTSEHGQAAIVTTPREGEGTTATAPGFAKEPFDRRGGRHAEQTGLGPIDSPSDASIEAGAVRHDNQRDDQQQEQEAGDGADAGAGDGTQA